MTDERQALFELIESVPMPVSALRPIGLLHHQHGQTRSARDLPGRFALITDKRALIRRRGPCPYQTAPMPLRIKMYPPINQSRNKQKTSSGTTIHVAWALIQQEKWTPFANENCKKKYL
jgi:hypothetical protein